jgi:hypothetical protein
VNGGAGTTGAGAAGTSGSTGAASNSPGGSPPCANASTVKERAPGKTQADTNC